MGSTVLRSQINGTLCLCVFVCFWIENYVTRCGKRHSERLLVGWVGWFLTVDRDSGSVSSPGTVSGRRKPNLISADLVACNFLTDWIWLDFALVRQNHLPPSLSLQIGRNQALALSRSCIVDTGETWKIRGQEGKIKLTWGKSEFHKEKLHKFYASLLLQKLRRILKRYRNSVRWRYSCPWPLAEQHVMKAYWPQH
jgi:hypothetical protein